MKWMHHGLAPLLLVLFCASLATARPRTTPPGSFLQYGVKTSSQLADQLLREPVVGRRYQIHFGLKPSELAEYFRKNLHYSVLKKPLRITVYGIDKKGRSIGKTRIVPAGTPVFVTSTGIPLLKAACGNPFREKLPVIVEPKEQEPKAKAPAAIEPPPEDIVTKVLGEQQPEISPSPVESLPEVFAEALPFEEVPSPVAPETPTLVAEVPPSAPTTVLPPLVRERSFGLLPLLPILGISLGGGGGGGDKEPIPEPGSLTALAGGVTLLGFRMFYNHRRGKKLKN